MQIVFFCKLWRRLARAKDHGIPGGGGAEHKPGTKGNDEAIKQHAKATSHDIHPDYEQILERGLCKPAERPIPSSNLYILLYTCTLTLLMNANPSLRLICL